MDIRKEIQSVLDAPSCYPEEERKSREIREKEMLDWYEKYQEVNVCYNLYGMDRVSSPPVDEWLDRGLFRKQRHEVNSRYFPAGSSFPYDYTLFMRDKWAFECFMRSNFGSQPVYVSSFAVLMQGTLWKANQEGSRTEISRNQLLNHFEGKKLVLKNTFGFGGSDIVIAEVLNGLVVREGKCCNLDTLIKELSEPNSYWLIQDFIHQHPVISKINESSVNTMRLLTYHSGEYVVSGKAVLRFGKKGSSVDNSDMGGYFTSLDENGVIGADMFNFREKSRSICPFAGLRIPFFADSVALAKEAHSCIPQLFTVGWDIVVTPDGPRILEGNDGWDPYLSQTPQGNAQRRIWNTCLQERQRFIERNIGEQR